MSEYVEVKMPSDDFGTRGLYFFKMPGDANKLITFLRQVIAWADEIAPQPSLILHPNGGEDNADCSPSKS